MHRLSLRKVLPTAATLGMLTMVFSVACGSSTNLAPGPLKGTQLVWEVWEQIDQSYAGRESLDLGAMVGTTLQSLLGLADAPAYPFLAEVGRLRGQPPSEVPPELTDVWRALVLYQDRWPDLDRAEVVKAAKLGLNKLLSIQGLLTMPPGHRATAPSCAARFLA